MNLMKIFSRPMGVGPSPINFGEEIVYYQYGEWQENDRHVSRLHAGLMIIWAEVRYWLMSRRCAIGDHDMVDAGSYANGDSGADHLACRRCDYEWSHQYY